MAQARHTQEESQTETRPRSRLDGHRAILWILALAFAVFVVVFMISPKEGADPKTGAPPGEVPAAQP